MGFSLGHSLYLTSAMRGAKVWFWFFLSAILLACSPDPERVNFDYLRSPSYFRADTANTDHPFCKVPQDIGTPEECAKVKKYHLTWVRPEDTVRLEGYRIYLDTTDPRLPGKHWKDLKDKPELASIIVTSKLPKDTLVFIFGNSGFKQDTLKTGSTKIFVLDSVDREDEVTGNIDFALVPVYSGDATPGNPEFANFQTRDKRPPDGFNPAFVPRATQVEIAWERPTDRVSFFDPSQDTGLIAGYSVELQLDGSVIPEKRKSFRPRILSYQVGTKDMLEGTKMDYDSSFERFVFTLPDSNRSAKRVSPLLSDSLHLVIGGIRPLDTLKVRLYAIDSSGNRNTNAMETVTLVTTDTTQPSKPVMSADSIAQNGFELRWLASSDSLRDGDTRLPGPKANFNIQKYRLIRTLIRDSTAKTTSLDRFDTTILVDSNVNGKLDTFKLAMKFLPPGTLFRMRLSAIDRSGFESLTDTLNVRTDSVRFAGVDSALECPVGFVPVPRGRFRLGDDGSSSPDEKPAANVVMGPYCIEPYEHRDSTGQRFVSNVTYKQAVEICKAVDKEFETDLCSEIEWERACEGPDATNLLHGIQSEGNNASILQTSCNQGTNDSAMAMSFELRNSLCLTTEGVYDMAGNLSEWVRDPYVANAYSQSGRKDTVYHDYSFKDSTATDSANGKAPPGIRGGNYLKTTFPQQSQTQALARCSNRDFAAQVRPVFRQECLSETRPKIAVIYAAGLAGHRCVDVPDTIPDVSRISEILPIASDSTRINIFLSGVLKPVDIKLPPDTAFNGRKPISALLTTRSLAVVTFVSNQGGKDQVDTLDAKEMRDTSQSALERIFLREAGNPEWSVRKQDGKFEIKYLYAYSVFGTKPARPYYSSRVIGFRCCSLAKTRPVPADTTAIAGN